MVRPEDSQNFAQRQADDECDYKTLTQICGLLHISERTYRRRVSPLTTNVPVVQIGRFKRYHYPSVIKALQEAGGR